MVAFAPRHRARWSALAPTVALTFALALPALPADEPLRSGVVDEAEAWISAVRIRIEPGKRARMGECRELGPEDLIVTLDGEEFRGPDEIVLDRERPPTVHAIVLDTSGSMVSDIAYAKHAAQEYIRQLRPDVERALLATFDESVILWRSYTDDRAALIEAARSVRMGSRTALLDAMYYTMRELDSHRERPVLILLTDGADTSSFHDVQSIERQVTLRPDLTVFTIGVGLEREQGHKPTRELLRHLAETTKGRFFEVAEGESLGKVFSSIRDILEAEATVTVVDPDPRAPRARIRVRSTNDNCRIDVIGASTDRPADEPSRRPIPRPYLDPPQSQEAPLHPAFLDVLARTDDLAVDPGCGSGRYFDRAFRARPPQGAWFFHVAQGQTSGCGPDVVLDHGYLYSPEVEELAAHHEKIRVMARPFEIPIPPLDDLATSPEQAVDHLARRALELARSELPPDTWSRLGEGHSRTPLDYPMVVHGMTFLEMRSALARACFLYPEYRAWALGKARERADRELEELAARYRARFPDEPEESIQAVARHSEEGLRIEATAEQPSEVDLQPFLSAWLGDLTAHDLFRRWERRRIDRFLRGEAAADPIDASFLEAWSELRRLFMVPSYARVLTMLVPVRDAGCDCIGYWRVVLPRPGWLKARMLGLTLGEEFTGERLDLVPDRPLAWLLLDRLGREAPGLLSHLREGGYVAADPVYELLGEPTGWAPDTAFDRARVVLELRPRIAGEPLRFVVDTHVDRAEDGTVTLAFDAIDRSALETSLPPDVAAEVEAAIGRLAGPAEVPDETGLPAVEPTGTWVWDPAPADDDDDESPE